MMDQYRVFGNPIKHSRSPFIHHSFAKQTSQQLNYQSELIALDDFEIKVTQFAAQGGKGANITVPFKEQAYDLCNELSQSALSAGAVNTLTFKNNKIYGDNTDGLGLVQDLLRQHVKLKGSRILLLGAGGAAKGVILPLLEQNPISIAVANRTVSRAKDLCKQFNDKKIDGYGFEQINKNEFDIIINATSASLDNKIPKISIQLIKPNVVCYDMVYAKKMTPFLSWAKEHGSVHLIDGLGMLVGQASESFAIWRNVKPEVEPVIESLRASILAE